LAKAVTHWLATLGALVLWLYALVVCGYNFRGLVLWAQNYAPPYSWYGGFVVLAGQCMILAAFGRSYYVRRERGDPPWKLFVFAVIFLAIQTAIAYAVPRH